MTSNLELWDKVRRVPEEHLKAFKRSGGFAGTAIKPMWAVQRMTEEFGPCGTGWGMEKPEYSIQAAGNETLVFCTATVWYGEPKKYLYGVGGDKILAQFSSGLKADDEAFKKAFTDAVGNALKFLGVGADIHMGLWDGNKYADEPRETPKNEAKPAYDEISKGIRRCVETGTYDDLKLWYKNKIKIIEAFPPGWATELMKEFDDAKEALKAKVA